MRTSAAAFELASNDLKVGPIGPNEQSKQRKEEKKKKRGRKVLASLGLLGISGWLATKLYLNSTDTDEHVSADEGFWFFAWLKKKPKKNAYDSLCDRKKC